MLENKLDQAIVRYNEITSKNGQLRHQIDLLRKDLLTSKEVQLKLTSKIDNIKDDAIKMSNNTNKLANSTESTNVEIMVLQQKYAKDKEEFKFEMKNLVSQLKEKDETRTIEEKGQSMEMSKTKSVMKGKGDYSNPLEVINMRLHNWKARNKEKKRIIDQYLKNVNIIRDVFEEIQKTTGIGTIEEIVTTFIKSEEQNYSLYNYANNLGQECDSYEEQNKKMENEIKRREGNNLETEKEIEEKKKELLAKINECSQNITQKKAEIEKGELSIKSIQEPFLQIMNIFMDSPLEIPVAEKIAFGKETIFSTQTIKQYLAEAEEYIITYITLLAEKNNIENPLISSMPLDKIKSTKDSEQGIKFNDMQDSNVVTKQKISNEETNEEMWNPNMLYSTICKMYKEKKANQIEKEVAEEKSPKKDKPIEKSEPKAAEAKIEATDKPKADEVKEAPKKEDVPVQKASEEAKQAV